MSAVGGAVRRHFARPAHHPRLRPIGVPHGVSGALYGSLIGRLSTETFSLSASLSLLTMAVIGGLGSELGALLGAAFLAAAPEVLRQFKDAEMVIYGAILVLCMLFLPGGLAGLGRRWIFSK